MLPAQLPSCAHNRLCSTACARLEVYRPIKQHTSLVMPQNLSCAALQMHRLEASKNSDNIYSSMLSKLRTFSLLQATAVASGAGTCTASATASAFASAVGNECFASAAASAAASCLVSTTFSVATASAFAEASHLPWEVFLCIWPLCNGYHMCVCWADCSAHCCFVRVGLPAQFSTYTPIWRAADQHVKQQWQAFRGTAAGLPCCSYLLLYRHAEHLLILPFSLCRPLPRPPHRQVSAMWRRCLHRQQQQPLLR